MTEGFGATSARERSQNGIYGFKFQLGIITQIKQKKLYFLTLGDFTKRKHNPDFKIQEEEEDDDDAMCV
jgi:hypothetical protein